MTWQIGQTSTTYDPSIAVAGQVAEFSRATIRTAIANEVIQPGLLVEIVPGNTDAVPLARVVQDTGDSGIPSAGILGIAIYDGARMNTGSADLTTYVGGAAYQVGEEFGYLMLGSIWAQWSGTTQTPFKAAPNVAHSSTSATARGYFTDAAISSTAGSEISASPSAIRTLEFTASSVGLVLLSISGDLGST